MAFAGPGPVSIGHALIIAGIVGLVATGGSRLWPVAMLCGVVSVVCAADYMIQMERTAPFQSFIQQTFGVGQVLAIIGGLLTIVGVAATRYLRARSRRSLQ